MENLPAGECDRTEDLGAWREKGLESGSIRVVIAGDQQELARCRELLEEALCGADRGGVRCLGIEEVAGDHDARRVGS